LIAFQRVPSQRRGIDGRTNEQILTMRVHSDFLRRRDREQKMQPRYGRRQIECLGAGCGRIRDNPAGARGREDLTIRVRKHNREIVFHWVRENSADKYDDRQKQTCSNDPFHG
jgi:hypothetical protein